MVQYIYVWGEGRRGEGGCQSFNTSKEVAIKAIGLNFLL